jgi:hypothetical protein
MVVTVAKLNPGKSVDPTLQIPNIESRRLHSSLSHFCGGFLLSGQSLISRLLAHVIFSGEQQNFGNAPQRRQGLGSTICCDLPLIDRSFAAICR